MYDEERTWTDENVNLVSTKHFPTVDSKVSGLGVGQEAIGDSNNIILNSAASFILLYVSNWGFL